MSFDQAGLNYVRRGMRTGGIIGGIGGGVLGGAAGGLPSSDKDIHGSERKRSVKERVIHGVVGAGVGAYAGHGIGRFGGAVHNAHKWLKGHRPTSARPDWLKNAKNKAEAKAAFRMQARKTHPDHGGNPNDFRKMHTEWKHHEPTFKTAMLAAFADEIEKIASIGALLGGVAGYKLGPNTAKGKIVGSLVGAGLGHAIGAAGGSAKRQLVDEHHEREMRELYGHQPVAGQSF